MTIGTRSGRLEAVARQDLRILRSDPAFVVIFTAMPLIFMAFNRSVIGAALAVEFPAAAANGAAFVVPGATVLFSSFLVGNLGFGIFREHGWGTWERLRASPLTPVELMAGKSAVPILTISLQIAVLLGGGSLLFGLELRGSLAGYVAVAAALAVMQVSLGFLLLSVCRSVIQLNALTNAGAMLLGGLGGALTPVEFLPGWAQAIAPFVPTYWAMEGFRAVTLEAGGMADVAGPIAVLLGFSVVFAGVAMRRFDVEATKVSWA
jgi:ABC-2 type transport system permease protein